MPTAAAPAFVTVATVRRDTAPAPAAGSVRALLAALIATAAAWAADGPPTADAAAPGATAPAARKLFDGQPKLIRFSTNSHRAAVYLRRKLDRYGQEAFGKTGLYQVNPKGDAAADAEIHHFGHGLWQTAYEVGIRPERGKPKYAIASAEDAEGIARGVQVIERFLERERAKGPRTVFVSSMHYHQSYTVGHDPRWQHEALAFAAFNRSHGGNLAIDVMTPSMAAHPHHLSDMYHPNSAGHEIYSHAWFAALLANEGLPVPAWSQTEMDEAVAAAKAASAACTVTPAGGERLTVGGPLTVTWTMPQTLAEKAKRVRIGLATDDWNTQWLGFAEAAPTGTYTWQIPETWLDRKDKAPPQACETCRVVVVASDIPSLSAQRFTISPR